MPLIFLCWTESLVPQPTLHPFRHPAWDLEDCWSRDKLNLSLPQLLITPLWIERALWTESLSEDRYGPGLWERSDVFNRKAKLTVGKGRASLLIEGLSTIIS